MELVNPVALDDAQVAELLAEATREHFVGATVSNIEKMSGGASRETWSFDVSLPGADALGLILRRDPGKTGSAGEEGWRGGKTTHSLDRTIEAELQSTVYKAGGLVAKVHFALPKNHPLGDCYVMDRIEGEVLAPRILRDDLFSSARPMMARQCGQILARLHSIDTGTLPAGLIKTPVAELIAYYRDLLDNLGRYYRDETTVGRAEHHPAFELTFRWLERNYPKEAPQTLVHGDFRNGNFIVGPEGIRAVLDWELGHVGDPMEDLGWLCVRAWRFGNNDNPVGGFGQVEDLFSAYEQAGGHKVDIEAVHFWEVMGTLKWGITCIFQAYKHVSGLIDSFEHMAIGRRACENEIDLLHLIKEG